MSIHRSEITTSNLFPPALQIFTKGSCPICTKPFRSGDDTVALREKGSDGVNHASKEHGSNISVHSGQSLHKQFNRRFCEANKIKSDHPKALQIYESHHMNTTIFIQKVKCLI